MPLNADPEVVLAAIEVWMPAYELASVDLLASREFAVEVLKKTRAALAELLRKSANHTEQCRRWEHRICVKVISAERPRDVRHSGMKHSSGVWMGRSFRIEGLSL